MHIKKVIIKNYKSYKNITIEDFSPGLNVIVGHNGSGKSNFLSAVQCVLNPESYSLRSDDKFHHINDEDESLEGSATVDVIFDNISRRFPIPKDEVMLRRVLSSKKDQFFVDNKSVTKHDMLNLLECIGFSKCNQYNIVRQGKVHELALASDEERFNLLLDIAGVKLYKDRREESLKMLEQANQNCSKIKEHIIEMDSKLQHLESEKKEIVDFNRKTKDKTKIEYLIYDHDRKSYETKLNEIEKEKQNILSNLHELEEIIQNKKNTLEKLSDELKEKLGSKSKLDHAYTDYLEKIKTLFELKSKLDVDLHAMKSSNFESSHDKSTYESQLKNIEETIKKHENDLKAKRQIFKKNKNLESALRERLKNDENISQENSFTQEIAQNKEEFSTQQFDEIKNNSVNLKTEMQEIQEKLKSVSELAEKMKSIRHEKIERKKSLWEKESEIQKSISILDQKSGSLEKKWNHSISRETHEGLRSLKTIISENSIDGVYGTIYENFEADSRFFTAIDVTAGNKLFNVMVDKSSIATNLLKIFKEKKYDGQVTFMPLDNLRAQIPTLPKLNDAIPLLSKINFDPKYENAFKLIFGQTLLCRNKDVAYKISKEHSFDGVTLDGDQVHHRGSIIGGFIDSKSSILEIHKNRTQTHRELEVLKTELNDITGEINKLTNEIQAVSSNISKQERTINELTFKQKILSSKLSEINHELCRLENFKKVEMSGVSVEGGSSSQILKDFSLNDESFDKLEEKLRSIIIENNKILSEINSIESSLNNNLYVLRSELKNKVSDLISSNLDEKIVKTNQEFLNIESNIKFMNSQVNETQKSLQDLKSQIIEIQSKNDEEKTQINIYNSQHSKTLGDLDGLENKASILRKKLHETENRLHGLEIGEDEDFTHLCDKSIKWLWKNLTSFENQLQKSAINQRAAEDFINLTNERDKSVKIYDDLEKSLAAIQDLIEKLDKRENETVMFTFKQVSYHFTNIFSQLFPEAYARLVLRRNQANMNLEAVQTEDIKAFSKVGIIVSFDKENKNFIEISQLSGGQKTLVTLALIFACQKCDPVPFYLFDEVDQALDPYHRQTFAKMLNELSENGQFIVTTFRPEILAYNPKCFLVTYKNRVSSINETSVKKAKSNVQIEEERKND